LEGIEPYEDDSSFIDAARAYVKGTLSLLENEEVELLALWKEANDYADDAWTPEVEADFTARQEEIIQRINNRIEADFTALTTAQTTFAAKNGFELEDTVE
jgi:hypothetical protein